MMKIGRNEPCPCGSGKKYKQCCLAKQAEAAQSPDELAWRRLRRQLEEFGPGLLRFMVDTYGDIALLEAWAEFLAEDEEDLEFDPDTPHAAVFFSWLFYRWSPDPLDTQVADASLHDVAPARAYLQRKGKHLDPLLRSYMEAALAAPLTFYEVLSVDPGRGFEAREFFSGRECWVYEQTGSDFLEPGCLVFGMLVAGERIVTADALGAVAIPPLHKIELLRLKQKYRLDSDFSQDKLCDLDLELIECYLGIADAQLDPDAPEFYNTDGEVLAPQALIYDIDSAEDAFVALHDLEFKASAADLRNSAELDAGGRISQVEITWRGVGNRVHTTWDNTILGRIVISAHRLRAEVNSDQRAEKLRGIIDTRLGSAARYRLTERESMQRMLSSEQGGVLPSAESEAEQAELTQRPEVQAQLRKTLAAHYENWVNEALPALGGQTPMQAAATSEGRERVAVLVEDIARLGEWQPGFDAAIVERLREKLRLI